MKYYKVTQKPYCCVGACLEMVLNRHGITLYDQEKITYELGLIVPPHLATNYHQARIGEKPAAGYGTQIQKKQYSINHFFEKYHIPLTETHLYITEANEARSFLSRHEDQDVMIILHCGALYDKSQVDWGHMVLFDHLEGDQAIIQENSPKRDIEKVGLPKLLEAVKLHGRKNGAGFYLIEDKLSTPASHSFQQQVLDFLLTIPKGKVVTYGQIAEILGHPGAARAVGNALHHNPDGNKYPCYKVVNSRGELSGRFAFGGITKQQERLEADGVPVGDGFRVDLGKYQFCARSDNSKA